MRSVVVYLSARLLVRAVRRIAQRHRIPEQALPDGADPAMRDRHFAEWREQGHQLIVRGVVFPGNPFLDFRHTPT